MQGIRKIMEYTGYSRAYSVHNTYISGPRSDLCREWHCGVKVRSTLPTCRFRLSARIFNPGYPRLASYIRTPKLPERPRHFKWEADRIALGPPLVQRARIKSIETTIGPKAQPTGNHVRLPLAHCWTEMRDLVAVRYFSLISYDLGIASGTWQR